VARTQLGAFVVGFGLLACGGKSFDDNGGSGGSGASTQGGSSHVAGSSGASSSGSHAGGTSASGGAAAGGTGQAGAPSDACSGLGDDSGTFILVEIINQTTETLYLGPTMATCGTVPYFTVDDENGKRLTIANDCRASCDVVRRDGPVGCPDVCFQPSVTRLAPGTSYVTNWSGIDFVRLQLPSECINPDYAPAQCDRARRIRPGTFVFSSVAGDAVDCSSAFNQNCGACDADAAGCGGGLVSGQIRTTTTKVVLNEAYGVYGDSTKKLPPPAPGNAPAGMVAGVQIIFTE